MANGIVAAPPSIRSVPLRASSGTDVLRAENKQERELLNLYRRLTPFI